MDAQTGNDGRHTPRSPVRLGCRELRTGTSRGARMDQQQHGRGHRRLRGRGRAASDRRLPLAPNVRVVARPNTLTTSARPGTSTKVDWSWDLYASRPGISADHIESGKRLVEAVTERIEAHGLPWQPVFNGGSVSFRRPGGYKLVVVDLYWNGPVRLAITLPAPPEQLNLVSPYPAPASRWSSGDREWGWVITTIDQIPTSDPPSTSREPPRPTTGRSVPRRESRSRRALASEDDHRGQPEGRQRDRDHVDQQRPTPTTSGPSRQPRKPSTTNDRSRSGGSVVPRERLLSALLSVKAGALPRGIRPFVFAEVSCGAPPGTRTPNPRIKSPLLYPLS